MITLKEIKRYPDTNSVEATWVDRTERPVDVPPTYTDDGELIAEAHTKIELVDVVIKCHSYDQVQMDMLAADLGADLAEHQWIIDEVQANMLPVPEPVVIIPTSITMRQCRLQLLADGVLDDVDTSVNTIGAAAKIEWEYASEIQRTNTLVPAMQSLLGWDEARTDQFFTEASEL